MMRIKTRNDPNHGKRVFPGINTLSDDRAAVTGRSRGCFLLGACCAGYWEERPS